MKKLIALCFMLYSSFLFCGNVFAESGEIKGAAPEKFERREPDRDKIQDLEGDEAAVEIRTDVSNVDVYLNGEYVGRTDLVIHDLRPGRYKVDLRKKGYEDEHIYIQVKKGRKIDYLIRMRKIVGYVVLENYLSNSSVYIDSNQYSYNNNIVGVEPGYHKITVKKFGYEDFSDYVDVYPKEYSYVDVEYTECEFYMTDFKVSRDAFNPDYTGSLGEVSFKFWVSAPETAVAKIYDENNEVVFLRNWSTFTTWENSFYWDGRGPDNRKVPGGVYTAEVSAGEYTLYCDVTVDYDLSYPLTTIGKAGAGIGNIPCAFGDKSGLIVPYFKVTPEVMKKNGAEQLEYSNTELSGGLLYDFASHVEFNVGITANIGLNDQSAMGFYISTKLYSTAPLYEGANFCYGIDFFWGMKEKEINPYNGLYTGNGLGAAVLLGIDSGNVYTGLTSSFAVSAGTGFAQKESNNVWHNSLVLSYKAMRNLKLNGWCSLDSAFGEYNGNPYKEYWLRGMDVGAELCFMPSMSSFVISIDASWACIFNEADYISFGILLSYLL